LLSLKIDKLQWKLTSLGDLATDISRRVDNPADSDFERFVGLEHFISGDLKIKNWTTTEKLTSSAKAFKKGDVLLARRNAYLRRASLVDFDGCCSGDAFVLREHNDKIVPGFLAFIVNCKEFWNFANANAEGTMSKRVKWRDLAKFQVRLPDIDTQKRLCSLLWSKDSYIESLEVLDNLVRLAKKAHFINRISGSEGWEVHKIKEFSNIVRGSSPRPAGSPEFFNGDFLPWVTVGTLTNNASPFLYESDIPSYLTEKGAKQTRIIPPDTVLLSNSGFSLGVPRILTFKAGANDGVAAFLDLRGIEKEYLYYYLDSITEHLRSRIAAGADQPNLNTTRIGNLDIPTPPASVQKEIVKEMFAFDETILSTSNSLVASRAVLKNLLNSMFTN